MLDLDPAVTSVNDEMSTDLEMNTVANFTEDSGVASGDTVTTVKTTPVDEDGGDITYTITDTENYAIDSETGEVTLTEAGAAEVNAGNDLPAFNVTATSAGENGSTSTVLDLDPAVTSVADAPTASIAVGDSDVITTLTDVIDNDAMTEAGFTQNTINSNDSWLSSTAETFTNTRTETQQEEYQQAHIESVVDIDAMNEAGYVQVDGEWKEVTGQQQELQDLTRTETHIVAVEPITTTGTVTQTVEVPGEAHSNNGVDVNKKSNVRIEFDEPTDNVEIDFNSFDQGTAKISFYDEDDNQLGSTINQSHTNGDRGYEVPDGATSMQVRNNSNSDDFEIDVSYRGQPTTETTTSIGEVVDTQAMIDAGYNYTELDGDTASKSGPQNVGNEGQGNVSGFNPEDIESSTISLGSEYANREITLEIDVDVDGSWDYNGSNAVGSTNDVFTITSNDVQIDSNNYSSSGSANGTDLDNSNHSYTYTVFLDENGDANLDFMVASTASNEVVDVNNITITNNGYTGWETTETVEVPYQEVVVVDVYSDVDPIMTTETTYTTETRDVEVEVEFLDTRTVTTEVEDNQIIYETETVIEYPVDISASLIDTDGSEALSISITNVPEGAILSEGIDNGDGTWDIEIPEGDTSIVDSLTITVPEGTEDLNLSIVATSTDLSTDDTNTVIDTQMDDYTQDIDGGEDSTFTVDFDEIEIDFDNINVENVETLDLGTGDDSNINVTNIDIDDILSMTDDNQLTILGDEGDTVSLDTETWEKGEDIEVDGNAFSTFTGGGDNGLAEVQLLIDNNVEVVNG